ncbi:MAG: TrbG/VirB9 family P-type conjugative transfer protein [Rhodospirillaceae bacterium]|nr:TrbG/VirB9 family P-type conjugative transfer protein [Rhodospirillaceae bacterium]
MPRGSAVFVVGPEGNAERVNCRVKGNYYIADRLFAAAELRLGAKPQQVVSKVSLLEAIEQRHWSGK